jgi:hypothetical protein
MNPDSLAHVANVLFGAAYLVRGILWLRILSIIACLVMAVFNYYAPAQPLWVAIYWNLFFSAINTVQVWVLMRERAAVTFSDEEEELHETIFRNISPVEFMKILRIAHWVTLEPGTVFIKKGSEVANLWLVSHGTVQVDIDANTRVELRDGAFLGEMAFVSGSPATGEVSTQTETRLLTWSFIELRRLFRRNPGIRSGFQAVISSDLASKLVPGGRKT